MSLVMVLLAVGAAGALLYFSGCVVIPEEPFVINGRNDRVVEQSAGICAEDAVGAVGEGSTEGIDPDRFSILSWNAHKGADTNWYDDLESLAGGVDLILLQEAALDPGLRRHLKALSRQWLLAIAFQSYQRDVGILSAGRIDPSSYCAVREAEPFLRIPKVALASTYPLRGMDERLLVVNVHLVNFTLGSEVVRRQIEAIKAIIANHPGPVIVAGDFNTWNDEREIVVNGELRKLGLRQVRFSPDNRVEFFDRKVDGVFFRGLEVTESHSHQVRTSDHNPLEVHFRYSDSRRS